MQIRTAALDTIGPIRRNRRFQKGLDVFGIDTSSLVGTV